MDGLNMYINIAMESVAEIMLLVLLASCMGRKHQTNTGRILVGWCLDLIGLLAVQISEWGMALSGVSLLPGTWAYFLYRLLFVADYAFYYFTALYHVWYLSALLHEAGNLSEKDRKLFQILYIVQLVTGIIAVAYFASSMWTGSLYQIDANGAPTYYPSYIPMTVVTCIVPVMSSALSWHYRKFLGKRNTILLVTFILLPLEVLWFDLVFGYCFSYVVLAFCILGIYISVDMAQGEELVRKRAELAQQERDMTNLRVSMMLTQIQPHFIFNSLGSIEQLCRIDPMRAAEATNFFAKYLRSNLESLAVTDLVPFSVELDHIHNYIWLEQMRFEEDLIYQEEIGSKDFRIPPLTIQPLIENAVKHGMRGLESGALTVKLTTAVYPGGVEVIISDNGCGFNPAKPLHGKHVGLHNVRERLETTTGGTMEVISNEGAGTTIRIRVPDPAS